jgi:uncharacterized protein YdaU (DUF1376 family)
MTNIFHVDFYPKDFMLDTQRQTNEQRGAYIQIISAMMAHNGAIDDDNKWLSNLCNCSVRKFDALKKELVEGGFITIWDRKIYQKRALEEVEKAQKRSEKASKSARKLHEKTPKTPRKSDENEQELNKNNDLTSASHQTPDTNIKDIPKGISKKTPLALMPCANETRFDEFWELYPRQRRGKKENAFKAYNTALEEKRATEEEIINGVKAYRNSDEVANGYAKGAAAWLNDDRWGNDYSITATGKHQAPENSRGSYFDRIASASSKIASSGVEENGSGYAEDFIDTDIDEAGKGYGGALQEASIESRHSSSCFAIGSSQTHQRGSKASRFSSGRYSQSFAGRNGVTDIPCD